MLPACSDWISLSVPSIFYHFHFPAVTPYPIIKQRFSPNKPCGGMYFAKYRPPTLVKLVIR